jgi:hypothetical protein
MRAKGPTRHPDIEITAVESVRPERTVEQGRGGKGMRRRSTGTYRLAEAPGGATHVTFELEVEPAGLADRLQWPITRAYLRRANQRALERLKEQLEAKPAAVR